MREIGALEAKNTLGALLDRVERGEEVVITRRGRPVAKLVRADSGSDRECQRALAAAGIRALRKGVTLGGGSVKDLIDEGRR
ncbi:type II toxin-antitoxin system Phd/YefM family antitoxin [Azospirillum halopraeferens]|uniref:type II toxin-antitoxin system Phd/YefM family antitoxin n=1 Tax=Azospirillum halopraeferens TaxID=34010 RepID=UPI00048BF504|nr:type II toxin-antitoxin system Phd/YefM family antitoxin [Azospirillum halopraeferens]